MPLTPRLPQGYHAQPAFHHQEGDVGYDFYRAYNAAREHDLLRSFWLITYDSDARGPMPSRTRWLSFADWMKAQHKGESEYHVFANPQTKLAEVRRWVESTEAGDLVEVAGH